MTRFWVNGSSPALISVGRRCMESGMSFVWPAGSAPYYVTPWGTAVPLVVDGYIPYLHLGSEQCAPRALTASHLRIPAPIGFEALVAGGGPHISSMTVDASRDIASDSVRSVPTSAPSYQASRDSSGNSARSGSSSSHDCVHSRVMADRSVSLHERHPLSGPCPENDAKDPGVHGLIAYSPRALQAVARRCGRWGRRRGENGVKGRHDQKFWSGSRGPKRPRRARVSQWKHEY